MLPSQKLDYKRFGPFEITEKISAPAYRIQLPAHWRIHDVFHVSHLVPYRTDTILGRQAEPPEPVEIDGETEYKIERIVKERVSSNGRRDYLVKWLGYGEVDNRWVPEYDLEHAQDVLAEFRARQPTLRPGKKRKR